MKKVCANFISTCERNPICEEKLAPTVATQSIKKLVEAVAPNKLQCTTVHYKATEENYIPYPTE